MSRYEHRDLEEVKNELVERNLPPVGERVDMIQRLLNDDSGSNKRTVEMTDTEVNASQERPSSEADLDSHTASGSSNNSADEDGGNTYIRNLLRYRLASVKYVGAFAISRVCHKAVDPGLHIESIGAIRLPLGAEDAKAIKKAGKQAPFGRGSATIVDPAS